MNKKKIRTILKWLVFLIYIAAMVYFMFFAEILGRTDAGISYRYNLVPFKEIKRFIKNAHQLGMIAVISNIFGNVVAFMPFGFCLPMVTDHKMKFFSVLLYTFNMSLTIELIQLISKVGSCDIDDLFLNTLGGVAGYLIFCLFKKIYLNYRGKQENEII